jgi:hypothetical protein
MFWSPYSSNNMVYKEICKLNQIFRAHDQQIWSLKSRKQKKKSKKAVLQIRDSGCPFDPWIRDEHPGPYFQELTNIFFGLKILTFFDADPRSFWPWTRDGKIRIRDNRIRNTATKDHYYHYSDSFNHFIKQVTERQHLFREKWEHREITIHEKKTILSDETSIIIIGK